MSYVCLQEDEFDCGFACLKMQIATATKNRHYLFLKKEKKDKNYTLLDLKKVAAKLKIEEKGIQFENKEEVFNYKNVICQIKSNDILHFVLLNYSTKNTVVISDPSFGQIQMNKEEFLKIFTGYSLMIENVEKTKFTVKRSLVKYSYLLLYIITLLIDFCLVYSLSYFASDKNNLLFCVITFIGIFISMGCKSVLLSLQSKYIDKKIKKLLSDANQKNIIFSPLEKKSLLSIKGSQVNAIYQTINQVFIALFITFILIINGIYNIILLVVTFLLVYFEKYIEFNNTKFKKYQINKSEDYFINTNNNLEELYDFLASNSSSIIKEKSSASVIVYSLIVLFVTLSNFFFEINSFAYLLFFIAYYLVYYDRIHHLLFDFENNLFSYEKCLNTYFDLSEYIQSL